LNTEFNKDSSSRYKEENVNNRYKRPRNEANDFYKMISKWEADWGKTHNSKLLVIPRGNEIALVERLYTTWKTVADKVYKAN
jgi:alpha-N-acetylglucosaminidase